MKAVLLFCGSALCILPLIAQQPTSPAAPPAISTQVPTSATTTTQNATSEACSKEITIYIDVSGTTTKQDPSQPNPNRVPLNLTADTLSKFVGNDAFIRPTDTVSLKFFGTIVKEQATGRADVLALLSKLSKSNEWNSVVSGLNGTDFSTYTLFDRLFEDITNRVKNSPAKRKIIFIASDFAHDPFNQPAQNNVQQRIDGFRATLATIRPLIGGGGSQPMSNVQVVGIYSPEPADPRQPNEAAVARQVKDDLRGAGVRMYQYNDDSAEAARTLQNYFAGSVTAAPSEETAVRLGGDDRVGMTVTNPNCDPVDVIGLDFVAADRRKRINLPPLRLTNEKHEVRIAAEQLSELWNRETTVIPILREGTTARVEPSSPFWLGDWVRLTQLEPYLYPWGDRERGSTLLSAVVNRSVRTTGAVVINGLEAGGRARSFTIPPGKGEQLMTFVFNLSLSQVQQLTGPSGTVRVDGAGLRIVSNSTAADSQQLPLAPAVPFTTGDVLAYTQTFAFILMGTLLVVISFRTFTSQADMPDRDQLGELGHGLGRLLWPLLATVVLFFRFGDIPGIDERLWIAVAVRTICGAAAILLLLRITLVYVIWKLLLERKFLPNDQAVRKRKLSNFVIWATAFVFVGYVAYTLLWQQAVKPNVFSQMLKGLLR